MKKTDLLYLKNSKDQFLTRRLAQTTFLCNQWASGFLLERGDFNEINVLPRSAFGFLDAVYKIKCSDKRSSYIEECLRHTFVKHNICSNNQA